MAGWWECKCGERANPPKAERCYRCHRSRAEGEKPPPPPPKKDHPDDPHGWWQCKVCNRDDENPPALQYCMWCHARRPGSVSNPEPPKPEPKPENPVEPKPGNPVEPKPGNPVEPKPGNPVEAPKNSFLQNLKVFILQSDTLVGTGLFLAGIFVPAARPVIAIVKPVWNTLVSWAKSSYRATANLFRKSPDDSNIA